MKNYKRRLVYLGLFTTILIGVGVFFYYLNPFEDKIPDQNAQELRKFDNLLLQSSEIQRIWWEGEESNEWARVKDQCLSSLKITEIFDESMLRCNPILIECVNNFLKNKKFQLNLKKKYQYVSKTNSNLMGIESGGFLFNLIDEKSNKSLDVLLKDFCHETYLDQRIYAYAELPKKSEGEDYRFDNFNQNIYLDRSLVSNYDINQWILFGDEKQTKNLEMKEGNDLFLPATHLTLSQMENYCTFRGKELMNAHIFDAATFLPMDLEEKSPKDNFRSPYFWSKKSKESKENISRCDYIFSKECLSKNKYRMNIISPTWAGLYDSMGGVMEAFKNPIEPNKNLKLSSFYLNSKSNWHRLGLRGHWDGEGFEFRNFDLAKVDIDPSIKEIKVGFRCMRRVR